MIASENFAPLAVMQAQGSVLTNKYAEGYPGRRYYGGCEHVDVIEQLAIDRLTALFGATYANVQPHSGAQANAAAMAALLKPGDTILGLALRARRPPHARDEAELLRQALRRRRVPRPEDDHLVDMAEVERLARERQPEADPGRLVRLSTATRLRRVPSHRRRGRRIPDGRHGALRRTRRRRTAPLPRPARPRGHLDDAQDPRRSPRRHHPHQRRGTGEEVQLLGVPRPAGRPARARHRRQGGLVQARRRARVPRAPATHARRGEDPRRPPPRRTIPARRASTSSPAAPTCIWCWSICANPNSTASRPKTGCTGWESR